MGAGMKRVWGVVMGLWLAAVASGPLHAETLARVLVLYSFHPEMPWQQAVDRGLRVGLKALSPPPVVFTENLDAGRLFRGQPPVELAQDRLAARVAALPKGTVIFYSLIFQDNTGRDVIPRDVAARLATHAAVPVFRAYRGQWEPIFGSH